LNCKGNDVILIQISTDYVFDDKIRLLYLPGDLPNSINSRGISKLKEEEYVQKTLSKYLIEELVLRGKSLDIYHFTDG
jgi:dTDP-4-dehydrorhamnose reductase